MDYVNLDTPSDHARWGVRVASSKLLPEELGLFATRDFQKDEQIAPYLGEELTATQRKHRYADRWGPYIYFKPWGHPSIDAQFYRGAAAFANDGTWIESTKNPEEFQPRKKDLSNIYLNRGWLRANREIRAGEELLMDYGKNYWKRRFQGIPAKGSWKPQLVTEQIGGGDDDIYNIIHAYTPVKKYGNHWFKRDDFFTAFGVHGGKVRTCLTYIFDNMSAGDIDGLVTGGSRSSPQVQIVGHIATGLNLPARLHLPQGKLPDYIQEAASGHKVLQWFPGFNHVLSARVREDVAQLNKREQWLEIPFGMEVSQAISGTAKQVGNLPFSNQDLQRIIVPVGSGMTLAGILTGLNELNINIPVVGIVVGQDPTKRLDVWAPSDWRDRVTLIRSTQNYHQSAPKEHLSIDGVCLDPIYEAKTVPFLQNGDLLWIVGHR